MSYVQRLSELSDLNTNFNASTNFSEIFLYQIELMYL